MGITFGDHLIDSGYHDITAEQEREREAREECARRGIDPDGISSDGFVNWRVVFSCSHCSGDCSSQPGGPSWDCPTYKARP